MTQWWSNSQIHCGLLFDSELSLIFLTSCVYCIYRLYICRIFAYTLIVEVFLYLCVSMYFNYIADGLIVISINCFPAVQSCLIDGVWLSQTWFIIESFQAQILVGVAQLFSSSLVQYGLLFNSWF